MIISAIEHAKKIIRLIIGVDTGCDGIVMPSAKVGCRVNMRLYRQNESRAYWARSGKDSYLTATYTLASSVVSFRNHVLQQNGIGQFNESFDWMNCLPRVCTE